MTDLTPNQADYAVVHADIVALLEAARRAAARSVNALMTATYWAVGRRIVEFEQGGQERAAYGEALIVRLSADLTARFGRGFSRQNLQQMRQFYLSWPPERLLQMPSAKSAATQIRQIPSGESLPFQTLQSASGQSPDLSALAQAFPLPWSAYVRLLSVKNPQARAFYETEALRGGWTISQLNRQSCAKPCTRCSLSAASRVFVEAGALRSRDGCMQQPAPVPIGANSELFGSKPHATIPHPSARKLWSLRGSVSTRTAVP